MAGIGESRVANGESVSQCGQRLGQVRIVSPQVHRRRERSPWAARVSGVKRRERRNDQDPSLPAIGQMPGGRREIGPRRPIRRRRGTRVGGVRVLLSPFRSDP